MCLSVEQLSNILYDDEVKEIYHACKNKYMSLDEKYHSRFTHIEGVCQMATLLAKKYKVDVKKAQIAAILHDYFKYESISEMKSMLDTKEEIKECEECPVLFHSYASSKALSKIFKINDNEIESAIKYHVFGHPNMTKLEEIILISDYTEFNRKYDDCIKTRSVLLDGKFDEAIYMSTIQTINHLIKNNQNPHPMQYEVLKEYERKINNE